MLIDHDREANAAYLTLGKQPIKSGEAVYQSDIIASPVNDGQVILDFDEQGRLIGIELLCVDQIVDPEVMG